MADIDAKLLEAAKMSSAQAAVILDRSRQAVSRGVRQQDGGYFKDSEVERLYLAVKAHHPAVAPAMRQLILDHFVALASRIDGDAPQFVSRAKSARRIWLVLRDFRAVRHQMWPTIEAILMRKDLAVDVFVDSLESERSFQAAVHALKLEIADRQDGLAMISLWQPEPTVELLQRMAIVDPHTPQAAVAYEWKNDEFEPMGSEEAMRFGSRYLERLFQSQPGDKLQIRRLGVDSGLESVEKELAILEAAEDAKV